MSFVRQVLLLAFIAIGLSSEQKFSFENYKLVRLYPTTKQHIDLVSELQNNQDFDVLNNVRALNEYIYVILSPSAFINYSSIFNQNQFEFKVVDNNIQRKIDMEQKSMGMHMHGKREAKDIVGKFARYSEIMNFIDDVVDANPSIASSYIAGKTFEGRNLKGLVLKTATSSRGIFIDCGFHAREWIAISSCVLMVDKLVKDFAKNEPTAVKILSKYEIHVFPLVNPDGYEYSHTTYRMWRKNRLVRPGVSCVGVDLNRNFGFQWMKGGSSSNACSDTYAGPSADSELETKAIEKAILAKKGFWDSYLTIHTFGQYWLTSWSYSTDLPADYNDILRVAQLGAKGITTVKGTTYTVGHSGRLFGILSGVSDDWAKGEAGIKYSYTLELSPGQSTNDPDASYMFSLPENRAPRVGEELYQGFRAFVNAIY